MESLLTLNEVAALMRCHRITIRRWIKAAKFPPPAVKVDRHPLWRASTIEAFIARGAFGSENER
ncbi:helix-turn-helix domain-containing protein [bacterium]|nr:helix-turn-helix domain-containing protein [bacterium]